MDVEQDLRATSDAMLATLERLEELELKKRALPPGTARFRKAAREVESLAATVFAQTHVQQALADVTVTMSEEHGAVLLPIDETASVRDIQEILRDWRAAERRLSAAAPDSADRTQAQAEADRLRAEYGRAYRAVVRTSDESDQGN